MGENVSQKCSEDELGTVSKQLLLHPPIEDLSCNTVSLPIWTPSPESLPVVPPQRRKSGKKERHHSKVTPLLKCLQIHEQKHRYSFVKPEDKTRRGTSLLQMAIRIKTAALDPRIGSTGPKSRCVKQLQWETDPGSREGTPVWFTKSPPPTQSSTSVDLSLTAGIQQLGSSGSSHAEAAAVHIQSWWRRRLARTAYLRRCRRKWAAGTITVAWLLLCQRRRITALLQAQRLRQLENCRCRAQHLAANWKRIQSSKRTIIHIPSLGYPLSQLRRLRRFDILQNTQISRLCDIRDENVDVIYVCPRHVTEDLVHYYSGLLGCDGAADKASSCTTRFVILTPEAVDYLPTHTMCLSTLLKYSPRTLKRIRGLIRGKEAYIVGGVAHVDDLAVADELGVAILGPEPALSHFYGSKSGGRRIFLEAEVDMPPGRRDIHSLNQLHAALAQLLPLNLEVQRWLLRMDWERGGRGTAHCDVCHLGCHDWALQKRQRYAPELWSTDWIQESVQARYLDEVPQWLARHARPDKTSDYPDWARFLETFLRQGGVVEACPPSDTVARLTVDLLLEPGGESAVLSCGDQLHGSCQLDALASAVPQTSVRPETLNAICGRVGRACLRRRIVGYVSVELAAFLDRHAEEQTVWAIDLHLAYSDQLAMTQMLLTMTGGRLNCHTSCLEVPAPAGEKCSQHQTAARPPVVNYHAVMGSQLFHSYLSHLYHKVFLLFCKEHGMGFDPESKQGTVFALYDSSERRTIGMITASEDLWRALVTFARNLSVIHQDISVSKTGETNFKELISQIRDVLHRIGPDNMPVVDKPAV